MSLGENSLVAAYQGKGQLKSRPSGTRVVTPTIEKWIKYQLYSPMFLLYCDLFFLLCKSSCGPPSNLSLRPLTYRFHLRRNTSSPSFHIIKIIPCYVHAQYSRRSDPAHKNRKQGS